MEMKMEYTKGEQCLGLSCRFYHQRPDMICFKQGVLPRCSPALKAARERLDAAAPKMAEALKDLNYKFRVLAEMAWWSDVRINEKLEQSTIALAKVDDEWVNQCGKL